MLLNSTIQKYVHLTCFQITLVFFFFENILFLKIHAIVKIQFI